MFFKIYYGEGIMKKYILIMCTLIASLAMSTANAATVTVNYDAGTLQDTTAITNYATTGANMDGMNLEITYGDGTSTSALWGNTGISSGVATWTGGFLELIGDSFYSSWNLVAQTGISSILLDAAIGNSLFDTTFDNSLGTVGSAAGRDFSVTSASADYNITATYIDAIGVAGNAAVGDIYRYLFIDFGQTAYTGTLGFLQDTDNLRDISPVPVPAAAWLFGSALLGFFGFSRRKNLA